MTVLLVDDQTSILSGLISGLDWDALGVTSIRTANNAFQAKNILKREPIDLMLCDIEMPGENGLSLLRWARFEGMALVCVFLTSHADFLFAKEAIQLNCFDYILQPARYELIQATVARAIARVQDESDRSKLERYGIVAKNHASGLLHGLFIDWCHGLPLSVPALCDMLAQLGTQKEPKDSCFVIWCHLLNWHTDPWPTCEWVYVINNIVEEFYGDGDYLVFPFDIDNASLGWFICAAHSEFSQPNHISLPLDKAYGILKEHLPCDLAFYVTRTATIREINNLSHVLLNARDRNVPAKTGIFCADSYPPACAEPFKSKKALTDRVKKYVEENLDRPINVNDVAEAMFMNADYLSRQFKGEENISLKEYIVKQKMEAAKIFLTTTTLPVSIIAAKLGYDNFSYFSQVYRKTMGNPPTEERR